MKIRPSGDGPFNHFRGIKAAEAQGLSSSNAEVKKYQIYAKEQHDLNGSKF